MVAVDDPDPPPEAKIKTESTAAPSSALPSVAAASAWGEKSTDELPDDNDETYGEAEEHHAYAYGHSFRRFAKRMLQRDAVRIANVMPPLRTDVSTVVPELAHKPMHAPKNLDNIRNLVNKRSGMNDEIHFLKLLVPMQSFMHAHTKLPKNDAGRVCSESACPLRPAHSGGSYSDRGTEAHPL